MITNRLKWLMAIVGALLLLKWLAPLQPVKQDDSPVLRQNETVRLEVPAQRHLESARVDSNQVPLETANPEPDHQPDRSSNPAFGKAFQARALPANPPPLAPPTPVAAPSAPTPVVPPPPKPPPLTVIGTWDDGKAPGVFISTPHHTVLAMKDSMLMSDYKVTAITPTGVSVLQVSNQRSWSLALPPNAPTSRPQSAGEATRSKRIAP